MAPLFDFAVAGGYGCMSQGVAYYKYMAHGGHSNQIVRKLLDQWERYASSIGC